MKIRIPVKPATIAPEKTLLTIEQTAEELSVCSKTIRIWIANGTIRARQLGRLWRIPKSEIERLSRFE